MLDSVNVRLAALLARGLGLRREEGQTLVEYSLILVLIAIASITALGLLSGKINGVLQQVVDGL
jgi:Flp pilus assembly pilin Flp